MSYLPDEICFFREVVWHGMRVPVGVGGWSFTCFELSLQERQLSH